MPAIEAAPVASSEPSLIKMEERKRSATSGRNDTSAPPLKKQATSVNGGSKPPHPDADMPWKDDLDVSFFLFPESRLFCFLVVLTILLLALSKRCHFAPNARV